MKATDEAKATTKSKRMTIAPRLISSADCRLDLDFAPRAVWPELLPGIAVNGFAWAGFRQSYFLDHTVDFSSMPARFRELHPELSFVELARLARASESVEQFPFAEIFEAHFEPLSDELWNTIQLVAFLPETLANWAMEHRLDPDDFGPLENLLSEAPGIFEEAGDLFADLQRREITRVEGVKILRLMSELLIEGAGLETVRARADESGQTWHRRLHTLRHPLSPAYEVHSQELDIDGQIQALLKIKEELLRSSPFDN